MCHKSTIKTKKKKKVFSFVYLFEIGKAVLQGLKFWKENELHGTEMLSDLIICM